MLRGSSGSCVGLSGGLDVLAVMAAFNTTAKGGWIPHVRQGGMGNDSEATPGSKFDGTGFVNVQIGQIQLAELAAE